MRPFLAPLAACAFLGIGVAALLAPRTLSRNFGLPVDDRAGFAYVGALGARDAVLGLLLVTFLASGDRRALAATLGLATLAGATDFTLVWRARGRAAAPSLAIHGLGTLGLLGVWALERRADGPG